MAASSDFFEREIQRLEKAIDGLLAKLQLHKISNPSFASIQQFYIEMSLLLDWDPLVFAEENLNYLEKTLEQESINKLVLIEKTFHQWKEQNAAENTLVSQQYLLIKKALLLKTKTAYFGDFVNRQL
jgi:hypothetical protein